MNARTARPNQVQRFAKDPFAGLMPKILSAVTAVVKAAGAVLIASVLFGLSRGWW